MTLYGILGDVVQGTRDTHAHETERKNHMKIADNKECGMAVLASMQRMAASVRHTPSTFKGGQDKGDDEDGDEKEEKKKARLEAMRKAKEEKARLKAEAEARGEAPPEKPSKKTKKTKEPEDPMTQKAKAVQDCMWSVKQVIGSLARCEGSMLPELKKRMIDALRDHMDKLTEKEQELSGMICGDMQGDPNDIDTASLIKNAEAEVEFAKARMKQ